LSLNRYNYVGDDPINRNDPSGLCDFVAAGITQSSANAPDIASYGYQAITVFPYAGGASQGFVGMFSGIEEAGLQALGSTSATYGAVVGLLEAAQQGGPINVTTFSGGAASFTAAVDWLNTNGGQSVTSMIGNITYVSPGAFGSLYTNSNTVVLLGNSVMDELATFFTTMTGHPPMYAIDCGHNFGCIARQFSQLLLSRQGQPCPNPQILNVTGPQAGAFMDYPSLWYSGAYDPNQDVFDPLDTTIDFGEPSEPMGVANSTITWIL
jgi:hypothetical protein